MDAIKNFFQFFPFSHKPFNEIALQPRPQLTVLVLDLETHQKKKIML